MYTAVGRVSYIEGNEANYIAMVGDPLRIASKDVLTKVKLKSDRNVANEKLHVDNLVNGTSRVVKEDVVNDDVDVSTKSKQELLLSEGYYYVNSSNNLDNYFVRIGPSLEHIAINKNGELVDKKRLYAFYATNMDAKKTKYKASIVYGSDGEISTVKVFSSDYKNLISELPVDDSFVKSILNSTEFDLSGSVLRTKIGDNDIKVTDNIIGKKDWKGVVASDYATIAVDHISNTPGETIKVINDESLSGFGVLTYSGGNYYLETIDDNNDIEKLEITKEVALDYVKNTLAKSGIDTYQTKIIINPVIADDNGLGSYDTNMVVTPSGDNVKPGDGIIIDGEAFTVSNMLRHNDGSDNVTIVMSNEIGSVKELSISEYSTYLSENRNRIDDPSENIEKTERKEQAGGRTFNYNKGVKQPAYFYGRAIFATKGIRQIKSDDTRREVSYLIQNMKQNLIRSNSIKVGKLVLKKDAFHVTDKDGTSSMPAVLLKVNINEAVVSA
jgi:hypothetical protein